MRKILSTLVVILFACCARTAEGPSYLYWMLDSNPSLPFAYAMVVAQSEGGEQKYLSFGDTGETEYYGSMVYGETVTSLSKIYTLLPSDYSKMSYFVELYSWDDDVVGVSDVYAFSVLENFKYSDMSTSAVRAPYHFSASVPEPSCGLLVLFGLGLLGLKRRERGGGRD